MTTATTTTETGEERPVAGDASDETLASSARAGDRAAFAVLVERHAGRVERFARVRLRDRHDAEEVAQEALMRAWRSIRTYREGEPFGAWVMAIARREVINVVRRRERSMRDRDPHGRRAHGAGDAGDAQPDGAMGIWALARNVLGADAFEALWLRYVEGMEPGQIARVMGRSRVGVRVLLHRARRSLRSELDSAGEEEARSAGRESEEVREVRVAAREVLCEQA